MTQETENDFMMDEIPSFFKIKFKAWHETDGILASRFSKEETLKITEQEMLEVYGEGNFEIASFEPVSAEEQAALELKYGLVPTPTNLN